MKLSRLLKLGLGLVTGSAFVLACSTNTNDTAGEVTGKTSEALTAGCSSYDFGSNTYAGTAVSYSSISQICPSFPTQASIQQVWTSPTYEGVYGSQVVGPTGGGIDYTDCPNQYVVEIDNASSFTNGEVSVWIPTVSDPTTCANTQVSLAVVQDGAIDGTPLPTILFGAESIAGKWQVDSTWQLLTGCYFDGGINADQLAAAWPTGITGMVRIVAAAQQITGTQKGQPVWSDVPVTVQLEADCPDR